jgi:hypothetical protein
MAVRPEPQMDEVDAFREKTGVGRCGGLEVGLLHGHELEALARERGEERGRVPVRGSGRGYALVHLVHGDASPWQPPCERGQELRACA